MKRKLTGILLCTAVLLAGCGKTKPTPATGSEASSVPSSAESEASSTFYADVPTASDTTSTTSDFSEFLTLADYKGVQLEAAKDAAAEKGNTVNIDYAGTIDGTAFDGGTAKGQNLLLGSGSFISGFEDQLIGHKAGDTVDVVVTFPEDYGVDELNGKEAHFDTTINAIYVKTVEQAFTDIIQKSEIKSYPQDVIDKWTKDFTASYQKDADAAGQSVEDYMESIGYTKEMLETNVKTYTQSELVARAILNAEGITPESKEYKDSENALSTQVGTITAEQAKQFGFTDVQVEFLTIYQTALGVVSSYAAQ